MDYFFSGPLRESCLLSNLQPYMESSEFRPPRFTPFSRFMMPSEKLLIPPPPKIVHVTSLGSSNVSKSSNDSKQDNSKPGNVEFLKPKTPARKVPITSTPIPAPTTKRKSRFSDAPPSQQAPPPKVLQIVQSQPIHEEKVTDGEKKSALVSAAAAAARINANLLKQGKIKEMPKNELTSKSTAPTASISSDLIVPTVEANINQIDDMYVTEVNINDIPLGCRNFLTRLTTQENINKTCMAYVSTRGKFMRQEEKKLLQEVGSTEKPLYLFVQSQNLENVKKALERIKQIINNHYVKKSKYQSDIMQAQANTLNNTVGFGFQQNSSVNTSASFPSIPSLPKPVAPLPHFQPALPSGNYVQEKVFIGLNSVPAHFDLTNKILGPNYRNFTFIANQTGAKVILRGRGSGFIEPTSGREAFEAMYTFISHPNQAGVDAAKTLVLNLIDTVKQELAPFLSNLKNQNQMPTGFAQMQNNYGLTHPNIVPSHNHSMASVSTYPFQQSSFPMPVHPQNIVNQYKPKENDYYEHENVLGYQHNFPERTSNSSNSGSSVDGKSTTQEKSRRKRFTEESPIPPTVTRPVASANETSSTKRQRQDSDLCDTREQSESASSFKTPTLPFWMSP